MKIHENNLLGLCTGLMVCTFFALGVTGCSVWTKAHSPRPGDAVSLHSPSSSEATPILNEPDRSRAAIHPTPERMPFNRREALAAAQNGDLSARLAGIEALGQAGDDEANRVLRQIALGDGEIYQSAAVVALGRQADWTAVRAATGEKSFRVRRAAAEALARGAADENTLAARTLLGDSSTSVQLAMVASLDEWPLAAAGPLLLDGLESRHFATRSAARDTLARRWAPAKSIEIEDLQPLVPPREMVAALRRAWSNEFGPEGTTAVAGESNSQPTTPSSTSFPSANRVFDPSEARRRLADGDKHARIEAAANLARNGYESGGRALEALTYDVDPEIRRETATALGLLADPLFFAPLVRLLDDEPAVRRAALRALESCAGGDMSDDGPAPPANSEEAAQRWKAWYLRGGRPRT